MNLYYAHLDVCFYADSRDQAEAIAGAIVDALQGNPIVHEADVFDVGEVEGRDELPQKALPGTAAK
mgnify:CR=1 FL=1